MRAERGVAVVLAVLASAAWGAKPAPPSLEFLEYLGELVETEGGELVDPLDMEEDAADEAADPKPASEEEHP